MAHGKRTEEKHRTRVARLLAAKATLGRRLQAMTDTPDRIFQALLVLFTLSLVVVGALQWRTLSRTDETLRAAQRPWVNFDSKIESPLRYMGEEIGMLVILSLRNGGHSPALNVRVIQKTLLVYDDEQARQIQHELCNHTFESDQEGWGSTIFPDSPPVLEPELVEISKEEIGKYIATGGPGHFTRPLIIGCIVYVSSVDASPHHTGFMYLIRPIPAQKNFELPKEPVPPSELELVPYGSGLVN